MENSTRIPFHYSPLPSKASSSSSSSAHCSYTETFFDTGWSDDTDPSQLPYEVTFSVDSILNAVPKGPSSSSEVGQRKKTIRTALALVLVTGVLSLGYKNPSSAQPETPDAVSRADSSDVSPEPSYVDHLEAAKEVFDGLARVVDGVRQEFATLQQAMTSTDVESSEITSPSIDRKAARKAARHLLADKELHNRSIASTVVLHLEGGYYQSGMVVDPRTILTLAPEGREVSLKEIGSGTRKHMGESWTAGVDDAQYATSIDPRTGLTAVAFDQDFFPKVPFEISEVAIGKCEVLIICGSPSGNLRGSSRMRIAAVVKDDHQDDKASNDVVAVETLGPAGARVAGGPVFNAQGKIVGIYLGNGLVRSFSSEEAASLVVDAKSKLKKPSFIPQKTPEDPSEHILEIATRYMGF